MPELILVVLQRPEGRKPSDVAHKSIEAVVARLEKQNGLSLGHSTCPEEVFVEASPGTEDMDSLEDTAVPRALYEELLRNYQQQQEEMRHVQQELERTRRQLVQQAKKLKEYGALVSEMKELRDLNRRLQDVLLLRLGSGECPPVLHAGVCLVQLHAEEGAGRWAKCPKAREGQRQLSSHPKEELPPFAMKLMGELINAAARHLEHPNGDMRGAAQRMSRQSVCHPPVMACVPSARGSARAHRNLRGAFG